MLAGEGIYWETDQQLNFDVAVYAQVNAAAKKAWYKLPSSGSHTEDLSKIRQGPDELFQDFVSRLMQTASRLIGDTQSRLLLVKHLAYENANTVCQDALRPFRKKGSNSDYIQHCWEIGPSYIQGLTIAAALQGKTVKDFLFQQRNQGPRPGKSIRPPGSCFGCGKMGHKVKWCPGKGIGIGAKRDRIVPEMQEREALG